MILRRLIGPLINRGMNAGIDRVARGRGDATPEQQAQARTTAKRTKEAMRVARRIGRF